MIVPAARSLRGGSVGHAVARARVEAEELGADSVVLEAGGGAPDQREVSIWSRDPASANQSSPVLPALGVEAEQLAGQHPGQGLLLVWRVVHTRGSLPATTNIMKLEIIFKL